jgi:hypothetical protein
MKRIHHKTVVNDSLTIQYATTRACRDWFNGPTPDHASGDIQVSLSKALRNAYGPGTSVRIQKATSNASWISMANAAHASSHQKRRIRQRYDNLKAVQITARPAKTVMMAIYRNSPSNVAHPAPYNSKAYL